MMALTVIHVLLLLSCLQFYSACKSNCHSNKKEEQNTHGSSQTQVTSYSEDPNEKVWLFAVDGRKRPYSFLNDNGKLVGFDVDLISKVCAIAQKKCDMVLAQFPECSLTDRNINYPGRGLMAEWFDGCPGYVISVDRKAGFEFTEPYLETDASFTVAPGNPSSFNPDASDYSAFTLIHLTGAVTNAQCLTRLKKKFGDIIIAPDLPTAKAFILNGTADVLFSPRNNIDGLEVLPQRVHCDDGGAGIMLKKGSQVATWWNPAFKTFFMSGGYGQLCSDSELIYSTTIKCLEDSRRRLQAGTSLYFKSKAEDPKLWLFAVSGRRKPFNYLDEKGQLTGFDIDFINAVCQFANKQCAPVLSQFTECSFTDRNINYPGRGLMEGWFDSCTGYANSLDRENGFDFTDAYLMSDSSFTVLPGNPSGFDPDQADFSSFTLTHLTGAYTNAECLNRLGKKFGNITIAANLPEAKSLLFDKQADVIFSPRSSIPDLETLPQRVHCEMTGTSMMTKKGSPLVKWWNQAFESFKQQGLFKKLCSDSIQKYNYPIKCLTSTP